MISPLAMRGRVGGTEGKERAPHLDVRGSIPGCVH